MIFLVSLHNYKQENRNSDQVQNFELPEIRKIMCTHILQKHRNRLNIQSLFNFVSFVHGAFPILPYRSCLGVILFAKNGTLYAFLSKQSFSVSYADTFSSTWHMLREHTWWRESLALSIRNRHNCVLIYQKM